MNTELSTNPANIQGKKDVLMKDIKGVVGDADELLKEVANAATEGYAVARTKVEGKLGEVKTRLGDARSAALFKARGAAHATDAYVSENPWKALGVATAAGVIIGFLLSRR